MTVTMPALLCSDEGQAWLLRCKLLKAAFDARDSGHYFKTASEIEDAYRALSPAAFMEKFS